MLGLHVSIIVGKKGRSQWNDVPFPFLCRIWSEFCFRASSVEGDRARRSRDSGVPQAWELMADRFSTTLGYLMPARSIHYAQIQHCLPSGWSRCCQPLYARAFGLRVQPWGCPAINQCSRQTPSSYHFSVGGEWKNCGERKKSTAWNLGTLAVLWEAKQREGKAGSDV